ncbi:MAG TPA: diaminopimelate epimerase, partial [Myxococcota bacterium]|nr:diaminopimelate epimerase [Myxococcota bacterium]
RHFGVGFDQMLVVRPSKNADFRMEIYNADGSQVEMCANGIRAFFKYLRDAGHTRADEIRVETLSGIVVPRWAGPDLVRVEMGRPILAPAKIPTRLGSGDGPVLDVALEVDGREVRLSSVSIGNPHAVLLVDRTRIQQRTWERGTGETLACGSGACAVGVVAMLRGLCDRDVTIELRGGELRIEWAGGDAPVYMTGPAAEVFRGTLEIPSAETGRR